MTMNRQLFEAASKFDVKLIQELNNQEVKEILPMLTRCVLCQALDESESWQTKRNEVMLIISEYSEVNHIVELLSADFHEVIRDSRSQLNLRKKQASVDGFVALSDEVLVRFEDCSAVTKLKIVVTEILWLCFQVEHQSSRHREEQTSSLVLSDISISPLLQATLYADAVSVLLCIAVQELPTIVNLCNVVEGLLRLDNGTNLILKLVVNSPWTVNEVCSSIVNNCANGESSDVRNRRTETLKALGRISPLCKPHVQHMCTNQNKLPHLIAWYYIGDSAQDTNLDKIAEFLFSNRALAKSLLINKSQGSEETALLSTIRSKLIEELTSLAERDITEQCYMKLMVLVKVYARLRDLIQYKFTEVEAESLLQTFFTLPLTCNKMMHLLILSLCLTIASIHQMAQYSQQLSTWLRSLAQNTKLYTESSDSSVGQFLLLLAIHYHGNQLSAISEMVASYLSIKPSAVKLSNTILKQIVTFEVFTEPVISKLTTMLFVTKNLCGDMKGYLPIHCVSQLLKSRAFSKHNVTIADWIFEQLSSVAFPLHPMVHQLIKNYVASTMPQQHAVRAANSPLDESKLRKVFAKDSEENFPSQLCLLYYVLSHQDAIHSDLSLINNKKKSVQPYSSSLLHSIPVKLLILKARKHRHQCADIYSSLMKLLYINFPHLCLANLWLPEPPAHRKSNELARLFKDKLVASDDKLSVHHLYLKLRCASENLSDDNIPIVLDAIKALRTEPVNPVPEHLAIILLETWLAYSRTVPEKLYLSTINALRDSLNEVTEEQTVMDPLLVLQSLQSYKHPVLISITLHLIEVYMKTSMRYYNLLAQSRVLLSSQSVLADAHEICYTLLSAQESAAVQILLEQCMPDQDDTSLLCNKRETQSLVCSYIHKTVIDNPGLAKLISFQGYDHRLIPIAIAGIPSMHICLDFIPEMLSQPDIRKQMFAVRLTSALCKQYPVHKTYNMSKLCINTLITLTGVLPSDSVIRHLLPLLPDVVSMCEDMPILHEDWIQLLSLLLPVISAYTGRIDLPRHKLKALSLNH